MSTESEQGTFPPKEARIMTLSRNARMFPKRVAGLLDVAVAAPEDQFGRVKDEHVHMHVRAEIFGFDFLQDDPEEPKLPRRRFYLRLHASGRTDLWGVTRDGWWVLLLGDGSELAKVSAETRTAAESLRNTLCKMCKLPPPAQPAA